MFNLVDLGYTLHHSNYLDEALERSNLTSYLSIMAQVSANLDFTLSDKYKKTVRLKLNANISL